MKLLHIADLHLGKRVCEYPMLEDQRVILDEICDLARAERVDALLVAGDVYDRPVPPQEATVLLSDFLCRFAEMGIPVLMIAGNHDSADRLSFCEPLLQKSGVYVAGESRGDVVTVTLPGDVAVHMLSFVRPTAMKHYLEGDVQSSEQMYRALLDKIDRSAAKYNVLLAHAFVTGGVPSDSEQASVGTVDAVPAEVFSAFDYVAMGHLHRPQSIGKVRYAGSPLAYSFSELGERKSVSLVELDGEVRVRTLPLHPRHEMREVRGGMQELLAMPYSEDYIRAVVTDEEVAPDARITLRTVFPNLARFAVENSHTRLEIEVGEGEHPERRDPLELFAEFYEYQCGTAPDERRLALMRTLLGEVSQ